MEYQLTLRTENSGLHVNNINVCSTDLALNWIYCTVYPYTLRGIEKRVKTMDDSYKELNPTVNLPPPPPPTFKSKLLQLMQ